MRVRVKNISMLTFRYTSVFSSFLNYTWCQVIYQRNNLNFPVTRCYISKRFFFNTTNFTTHQMFNHPKKIDKQWKFQYSKLKKDFKQNICLITKFWQHLKFKKKYFINSILKLCVISRVFLRVSWPRAEALKMTLVPVN